MRWLFLQYSVLLLFYISIGCEAQSQTKTKRLVIPTYKKNGHNFWTFFVAFKNLIADQYTDTKQTWDEANDLVKDTFSDTATTVKTTTTSSTTTVSPILDSDDNSTMTTSATTTTTTEKYRVSRYEFGRILGRNFRGLQKIFQDDLNVALNQSNYNIEGYKQELQNAIGTPAPKTRGKTISVQKKRRKATTTQSPSFFRF